MKTTINFNDFCDAFRDYDRDSQFSYEAKRALFDYIEEYEADAQEETELDIIALCVEWTEWDSFKDLQENYTDISTFDDLTDNTTAFELSNGHILAIDF